MKKTFFSFVLALTAALVVNAATSQVTLSFTSNGWGLPEGSANIAKGPQQHSNGTYTIELAGDFGYYFNSQGFLLLGKQNATLTLPAFNFRVSKIAITGRSNASALVEQNIFIGEDAISDKTVGAKNVNTYLIPNDKRASGTIYTLKILSTHNTNITKIEIFKEDAGDPEPLIAKKDTISVHAAVERIKINDSRPCYVDGMVDSIEIFNLFDGNINIWMKDVSVANPDTIRAFKILNSNNAKFVAGENIPFAKGDTIRVFGKTLQTYKEISSGNVINEIYEGCFIEKLGTSTAVTPTQPIIPDTISVDSALALLSAGDKDIHIVRGQVKSFDDVSTLSSQGVIKEMTLCDLDKENKSIVAYLIYGGPDNAQFAATRKCGLPFELNDTILVLSRGLKDYNGKKEINSGYYVSRDGKEDLPDRCEVCKDNPDTISVDSAINYISNEGFCSKIVKGIVKSYTKSVRNDGAIENVVLVDVDDPTKTIICYRMFAGYNGTDTAKYSSIYDLQFVKGDTIYVYGKSLEEYKFEPYMERFCYYHGREGVLKRTLLNFDTFVANHKDNVSDVNFTFTRQGDNNLKMIVKQTATDKYSIYGNYEIINTTLTLSNGTKVILTSGELNIDVKYMMGDDIYYTIEIDAMDANKRHYMQTLNYVSDIYLNDNPNITVAKAYEIGMTLASGSSTSKAYNVYGIFVRQKEAWSSYNNHSFYLADSKNLGSGKFQGYRVYPESKKLADAAVLGDTVVFENFHIYNYNGTIMNNEDKIYKKVKSADVPKLRDVAAPEKTVSEAISLDATKYYTVAGAVSRVVTDTIYMTLDNDIIYAYKAGVEVGNGTVEEGDFIKVKGVISKKDTKSIIYYGLVVDKTKTCYITKNAINGTIIGPNYDARMSTVQLTANPNYGYHFIKWSDGITVNPRTIELTQDTTFTAEFARNTYAITTKSSNTQLGSTIGDTTALYLDEVEISAIANYGYHFARWSDGNTSNPRIISVTKDNVYQAIFEKNVYSITMQCNHEHGNVLGVAQANYLDNVTLTAVPNYGYYFVQWSDGITDNPRTIELTQDTTFIAEFLINGTGTCGDEHALMWEYDSETKTLTISGNGTLNSNLTFGVEAPTEVEKLVIAEGVTSIGNSAFSGYATLKEVTIATSVQTVYEKAFYNCTALENIYVYRNIPSTAYSNTFDGINKFSCTLHVLQSSIDMYNAATGWRDFYYKEAIDAISVTEPLANVEVTTTENTAEVTWPIVASAESYDLIISKEGDEYCTLRFNNLGQLIGISFAPSMRNNNQQEQTTGFRFIVTGLSSKTQYSYSIVAKDASNTILNTETGTFSTLGGTITNVENMTAPLDRDKIGLYNKVLKNGHLYILRDGKVFDSTGRKLK